MILQSTILIRLNKGFGKFFSKNTKYFSQTSSLWTTTHSGLKYQDVFVGIGREASNEDIVTVHYRGSLQSNGLEFDNSMKRDPITFRLGSSRVIQGWEEGLVGMKLNGHRNLIIPPHLGYGSQTVGSIPSNSTLIFECKLIQIGYSEDYGVNKPISLFSKLFKRLF